MSGMLEPSSPSSNSPLDFIAVVCELVGCFLVTVFFVLSLMMWRTSSKFSETLKEHDDNVYIQGAICHLKCSNQAVHVQVCEWLHKVTWEADFTTTEISYTVDREIFMLKINSHKNVHGVKFSRFHSIHEIFFTGLCL